MPRTPRSITEMAHLLGDKVTEAYVYAEEIHRNEKRGSGEPYITHPVAVAKILFDAGADTDVVCAALLHDTLESGDRGVIADHIYANFGDQILYLVEAVSKDSDIHDKLTQQASYMAQIARSFDADTFVFMIKIADLIHNMSTIEGLPAQRKKLWIEELHTQYFPTFTSLFHRIPLGQRPLFGALMDRLEAELGKYDQLHNTNRKE